MRDEIKTIVLVATMYTDDVPALVKEMNITTDCIVVNQCNCDSETLERITLENQLIIAVNSPERGLSRSRNKALSLVTDEYDVVVFTDDDIEFYDNYENLIKNAYSDSKKDAVVFNVRRVNGRLNKKLGNRINQISLFRVCSVSITMKRDKIRGITFDSLFGAGSSKFILGEENIFVSDCLKNGMRIYSDKGILCKICDKRPSTWNEGKNENMMYAKGASFKRMHNYMYVLLIIDFALRKYRIYKNTISMKKAVQSMIAGSRDYARISKRGNTDI